MNKPFISSWRFHDLFIMGTARFSSFMDLVSFSPTLRDANQAHCWSMLLRKILIELSKKLIDVVVQENTEAGVESLIVLFALLSF